MKYSNLEPTPKRIFKPLERSSSNDFLRQIEVLDSSGLATSLMEILEAAEAVLHNNREGIDIVTRECILTEFLKRITALVSREMKSCNYGLIMEDKI